MSLDSLSLDSSAYAQTARMPSFWALLLGDCSGRALGFQEILVSFLGSEKASTKDKV